MIKANKYVENFMQLTTNILWNTFGNIFYLGCQWLLSVIVVRISGNYADAGVLSLAMSITGIFAILSSFNVRNYQVSDLEEKYGQADYIAHRCITCTVAFVLCIAFALCNSYKTAVALSIICFMLIKTVEALADVFHGILQKQWRFDIIGKSCIYRGIALLLAFTVIYKVSGNLWLALFSMALLTFVAFVLYDFCLTRKLTIINVCFNRVKLLQLTKDCLPLLIYVFFLNLIVPTARFFIERYHGEEVLGYYGSVASIALIVQATVGLVFTPLNGIITDYYANRDNKAILRLSGKVIMLLILVTLVVLAGAWLLGKSVLVLMFGESIAPYVWLLYPTIIASCLTGLVWFLGMLLTIMRSMQSLIIGAVVGFVACVGLCLVIIPSVAYDGANIATIVGLAVVAVIYIVAVLKMLFVSK